jgi:hypothetical protein
MNTLYGKQLKANEKMKQRKPVNRTYRAVSVTGRRSPYGCETSVLPHFSNIEFTDGGVVSLTLRLPRKK